MDRKDVSFSRNDSRFLYLTHDNENLSENEDDNAITSLRAGDLTAELIKLSNNFNNNQNENKNQASQSIQQSQQQQQRNVSGIGILEFSPNMAGNDVTPVNLDFSSKKPRKQTQNQNSFLTLAGKAF